MKKKRIITNGGAGSLKDMIDQLLGNPKAWDLSTIEGAPQRKPDHIQTSDMFGSSTFMWWDEMRKVTIVGHGSIIGDVVAIKVCPETDIVIDDNDEATVFSNLNSTYEPDPTPCRLSVQLSYRRWKINKDLELNVLDIK